MDGWVGDGWVDGHVNAQRVNARTVREVDGYGWFQLGAFLLSRCMAQLLFSLCSFQ